jgi:chromosome segregation ATPase
MVRRAVIIAAGLCILFVFVLKAHAQQPEVSKEHPQAQGQDREAELRKDIGSLEQQLKALYAEMAPIEAQTKPLRLQISQQIDPQVKPLRQKIEQIEAQAKPLREKIAQIEAQAAPIREKISVLNDKIKIKRDRLELMRDEHREHHEAKTDQRPAEQHQTQQQKAPAAGVKE